MSTEFETRRKKFLGKMKPGGVAILFGAPPSHGRFRQDSDFFYLTGVEEPNAILVLVKDKKKSILVLPPKDKKQETWLGPMLGVNGALKMGFDEAYPLEKRKEILKKYLRNASALYYTFGVDRSQDDFILQILKELKGEVREGTAVPKVFYDLLAFIHEMRLVKTREEIDSMRKAASITAKAHLRAMESCKPGMMEFELQAILEHEFRRQGAFFNAFDTIVAGGPNARVLHYTANTGVLRDGQLVLVDGGCEYNYYTADISRTFPIGGKFTQAQRALYDLVWQAQQEVIRMVKPGVSYEALHQKTLEVLTQGLVDLKILKGKVKNLVEEKKYLPFFMHKTGHWIGMDCHDVGEYKRDGKPRILKPGMVFTVEPGLYIPNSSKVPKKFRNIGIRIEDDILVTRRGYEILTKEVPSQSDEIEGLRKKSLISLSSKKTPAS